MAFHTGKQSLQESKEPNFKSEIGQSQLTLTDNQVSYQLIIQYCSTYSTVVTSSSLLVEGVS